MSGTLIVRLTEDQMKTLEAFISRVNLNAKEVNAFNALIQALSQASPEEEPAVSKPVE